MAPQDAALTGTAGFDRGGRAKMLLQGPAGQDHQMIFHDPLVVAPPPTPRDRGQSPANTTKWDRRQRPKKQNRQAARTKAILAVQQDLARCR